jgi:hypothetical protein
VAIPESQLDTWSKQGSIAQSQSTYATVRSALEDNPPYASRSYSIFLQGSYGNDTNIYADSDVDVVISTSSVYYEDTSELDPAALKLYEAASSAATYTYGDFKKEVIAQLGKKFGSSVQPRKKAVFIQGNGSRRDADVLPAAQYRRWYGYSPLNTTDYAEGIVFWASDGTKIINYPKQHSANCTAKQQARSGWFKPSVRILKNMRNSMIAKDYLAEGVAPSYFLEGMLYNVPNVNFGTSYEDSIVHSINWIKNCDQSKLLCANEQYMLLNDHSPVTWRALCLIEGSSSFAIRPAPRRVIPPAIPAERLLPGRGDRANPPMRFDLTPRFGGCDGAMSGPGGYSCVLDE